MTASAGSGITPALASVAQQQRLRSPRTIRTVQRPWSAPLPEQSAASTVAGRPPAGALRRSLNACVYEGMAAELVSACAGGAMLTGWALHLGGGPLVVGTVGALTQMAQAVQIPAAWMTARFGARRTAVVAVLASRQVLLPLVLLPFLPLSPAAARAVFLGTAGLSAVLGIIGNNAWTTWMGDLVPARIRGRYFGRRTAVCTLAGAAGSFAAGSFLDFARRREAEGEALAALAALACVAGLVAAALMSRQHDPGGARVAFAPRLVLQPLRDARARRLIAYLAAWNGAVGLSATFYTAFMLQNLRMTFALVALQGTAAAVVRVFAAPAWGRVIDRLGARPVLVACSFGISAIPLVWLLPAPGMLWPIALDAVLSGTLWAGHQLAAFQLPLALAPARERPFHLALCSMAGGAAFAAATAGAGLLAQRLPETPLVFGHEFARYQVLFLLSAFGRLAAALLSLRIAEPQSRPVGRLFRMVAEAARPAGLRGARAVTRVAAAIAGR